MSKSLQDQLLKAGLVDKKKLKETQKQQRKEKKQQPKGQQVIDEVKQSAQQAQKNKAERDRQLNLQKNAEAEKKAILAQIKQLIEVNRITCPSGEINYQFTDDKTTKRVVVDGQVQQQLINGIVAIVRFGDSYAMVPKRVAEKIAQRDDKAVVVLNEVAKDAVDEDDPYADYQVPDDLMW